MTESASKSSVRVIAVGCSDKGLFRNYLRNLLVLLGVLRKDADEVKGVLQTKRFGEIVLCTAQRPGQCEDASVPKLAPDIRLVLFANMNGLVKAVASAIDGSTEAVGELYIVDHGSAGRQVMGSDKADLSGGGLSVDTWTAALALSGLNDSLSPDAIVHLEGCSVGKDANALKNFSQALGGRRVRGAVQAQETGDAVTGQAMGPEGPIREARGNVVRTVPPNALTSLHRMLP